MLQCRNRATWPHEEGLPWVADEAADAYAADGWRGKQSETDGGGTENVRGKAPLQSAERCRTWVADRQHVVVVLLGMTSFGHVVEPWFAGLAVRITTVGTWLSRSRPDQSLWAACWPMTPRLQMNPRDPPVRPVSGFEHILHVAHDREIADWYASCAWLNS